MNATNNQDRKDNRINKWVVGGIVLAIILLIMLLRSCSAGSNEYHMVLNGDNPFEIALNDQYTDPGVTFVDENDKPVSSKKQAELEKEMTITGLDQIDTAVSGEYPVTYQYEDQTLDRVVKVLAGNQTPGGSDNQDTNKPGTNDDETDKPGNNDDETNNNGNQTTDPVTGDPTKPVYKLPANVTFEDLIVVYDGNVHSITVQNLPQGIEAIYTNNTGVNAGRYDASVVLVLSDSMKGTYSSVEPASMTATLTIKQATPNYTIPTGLTAKVGQTLADVKLPKGFAFESSLTTSVGPVGYNAFLVSYTPEDTVNYKTVTHIEVLIKVIDPNGGGNNGGGDDDDDRRVVYNLPSNVTFSNRTVTYNGQTYTIWVANVPSGINVRYENNSGKDAGIYNSTAYFTVGDELKDKCYAVNPSSMSATLIINKAVPHYTVPTGLTAKVGQTLANVKLPKGFTFVDPLTTSVGTVGSHVFKVNFTPEDTKNYETVTGIDVIINVSDPGPGPGPGPDKPVYKLPGNTRFDDLIVTYDGTEYSITAVNIPNGIIASYSNATRSDAGTQTAKVVFSLSESLAAQYSGVEPNSMTAVLTINPATPSYTVPTGLTAVEGQTLADIRSQLGEGFSFEDPLTTSVGTPGNNDFTVTYRPSSSNYKTVTGIKVTIHVTRKPDPSKPKFTMPTNVAFNNLTETYTGTEYSITAVNVPDELSVAYRNNTRTNAGSQTAEAIFSLSDKGLENYSGIEGTTVMTATLTINPADPSYAVPTGLTAVEGQTLNDVVNQLGKGFSFEDPLTTSVGAPGDNEFTVTYTPDSSNYKVVTGIKVTIHVTRKPDPGKPKFPMPTNVAFNNLTETYTGTEYSITAVNVPDELSVAYRNNTRTNAGSQTAEAIFSLSDKGLENYSGIEGTTIMTATLTINPADPSYTVPTGLEAIEGQTLADVTLEEGFSFEDPLTTPVGAVGDNEFSVTYTPSSSNYKVVTGIKVTIHVKSAKTTLVLPSNVTLPDVEGIYGEQAVFETTVVNLPDHIVAVVYTNNTRSTAGIQTARVDFSIKPEWQDRYVDVSPSYLEATINIHKAVPSYTKPTGLTAKEGQTLGDVASQLGTGFEFEDDPSTSVGGEGDNNFTVKYTPGDTENYQVITGILVTIHVSEDVGIVDKSELEKAISDAEAINEADWTAESYSKFSSAYATAIGMPESTQQTVDEKTAAIRAALALLKKDDGSGDIKDPVDKTALIQATQVAEAIKETDWTPESYAAFLAAYATASSMPEETQDEVDAKTDAITAAIDLLKADSTDPDIKDPDTEEVNMDALMAIIEETDNVDPFAYTADSYAAYEEAFTKALDLPEDTQSEVDAKVSAIRAALNLLVPETNDPDLGGSDILDPSAISNADILQTVTEDESIEEETEESAEATEGENAEENDVTEENESTGEGEVIGEGEETQEGEDTENTNNVPESLPPASGEEAPPATNKREDAYVEEPVEYVEKGNDEEEPDAQGEETQEVAVEESHEDSNSGEGEDAQ